MKKFIHAPQRLALIVGLLVGSFATIPAMAATITYHFSGDVDHVGRQLQSSTQPFTTSSMMSGVMTVNTQDTTTPNNNRGTYSIQSFAVTVGGYTATFGPSTSNLVEIRNVSGGDRFYVDAVDLNGNLVNTFLPNLFDIRLGGPNTIFNNDHLPGSLPPSIDAFTNETTWRLTFSPGGGVPRTVSGDLSSITVVPLPAAVVLFGVGLVALIGLGAGGLRNIRLPQA